MKEKIATVCELAGRVCGRDVFIKRSKFHYFWDTLRKGRTLAPGERTTHNIDIFIVDNTQSEQLYRQYQVNGVAAKFQVDTGAALSIISKN